MYIDIAKINFAGRGGSGPQPVPRTDGLYFTTGGLTAARISNNYNEYYNIHGKYLKYSFDGLNWEDWTTAITLRRGEKMYVMGEDPYVFRAAHSTTLFSSTQPVEAHGNVMSLVNWAEEIYMEYSMYGLFRDMTKLITAPELPATKLYDYCYGRMFEGCTSLTTAPELPATTLFANCYNDMFYGCTSLTTAPELPATTLAEGCYEYMFEGCTSLTTAPALPATNMESRCYALMFERCTALTTAPELPATVLNNECYLSMFSGCSALVNAPELPATILADRCYANMFYGCTALTEAPELPATTLADFCYANMFHGCLSLTTAPELPATTLAERCYNAMFHSCSALTTAPALPATALAISCYANMFSGCTALTEAPELPATALIEKCYGAMFHGDATLNWIKSLNLDYSSDDLINWVYNVAANGVFVMNIDAEWNADDHRGSNGVPENWKVIYYDSANGKYYIDRERSQQCDKYGNIKYESFYITPNGNNGITAIPNNNYYTLHRKYLKYSFDEEEWNDWTTYVTIQPNQKMYIKGEDDYVWTSSKSGKLITAGGNYNVGGSISSLTNGITDVKQSTFEQLFYNDNKIVDASKLILPATVVVRTSYASMFSGCSALTTAPTLPATTLASYCYYDMFKGCTKLTTAPALPATTLYDNCYYEMFYGCTALTTAPALPATTLTSYCYYSMFYGCTKLTTAPALPATTLASYCYYWMFRGCTALTTAPALPATTLVSECYYGMFYGCTSLVNAPVLPATTLAYNCYKNMFNTDATLNWIKSLNIDYNSSYLQTWVNGVANDGVFVANINATYDPESIRGVNGIPENWLVIYYDSAEDKYYLDKGKQQECDDHGNPIGAKYLIPDYGVGEYDQYIDTGYIPNNNTEFILDFELTDYHQRDQWYSMFGTSRFENYSFRHFGYSGATDEAFFEWGDNLGTEGGTRVRDNFLGRHTLRMDQFNVYLDENLVLTLPEPTADESTCGSLSLFRSIAPGAGNLHSYYKLYHCTIKENGIIIHDYVPSMNENGQAGLTDNVTGEFLFGTGGFILVEDGE